MKSTKQSAATQFSLYEVCKPKFETVIVRSESIISIGVPKDLPKLKIGKDNKVEYSR